MVTVQIQIELFKIDELSEEAREEAIFKHKCFLDSIPIDYENEHGELVNEYHEHTETEALENIEANEYLYLQDGELAETVLYTGKHPRAGEHIFKYQGKEYKIN